ncbi:uncharacterized protein LOC122310231 [Carya illinoinensis]|uniref:uncharacterized protein LOC122310231 n=1 Tax=Carya illinoinensis TaxID=32201 RepID=UPI001C71AD0B|nr:uncharacterized protein LOC122310231 [Carya illinoinensis]
MRNRLRQCGEELQKWNMKVNRRAPTEIRQKLKRLGELQEAGSGDHHEDVRNLQREIDLALVEDELRWNQRAKQHWLQKEDKNTTFYHLHASHRRKVNRISQVLDHRNNMVSEKEEIRATLTRFFLELFTSSSPSGRLHKGPTLKSNKKHELFPTIEV